MIYEIRTYTVAPTTLAEVEKRFGEVIELRKKYSELVGFWHTDIGPLNQIVHMWAYKDFAERTQARAESRKETKWPPNIREFITDMRAEVVVPFASLPPIKPGKVGPYFELRYYTLRQGALPAVTKSWEERLPERMKRSPLLLAGGVEFGRANGFVHIWAYNSLDQRAEVRAEAIKDGIWPPPGGRENLLTQESLIMMPAAFSPLQ